MCLIKVKKVEDEEDYESIRRRRRVYRRDRIVVPQPSGYPVLPPPQPVPLLSPPPLLPMPRTDVQHITVSRPSSSDSSHHDHRDVRYQRREVRYERDYSPERHHEYRYVEAPEPRRERSRSRRRSTSRRRDDYYDDEIRVKTKKTYYD